MTRQRTWQLKRLTAGLCIVCGKNPLYAGTQRCESCNNKHREQQRKRYNSNPWTPGGLGRPPAKE